MTNLCRGFIVVNYLVFEAQFVISNANFNQLYLFSGLPFLKLPIRVLTPFLKVKLVKDAYNSSFS